MSEKRADLIFSISERIAVKLFNEVAGPEFLKHGLSPHEAMCALADAVSRYIVASVTMNSNDDDKTKAAEASVEVFLRHTRNIAPEYIGLMSDFELIGSKPN